MKVLHEGLGDSKYRPCPLLAQYVDAGMSSTNSAADSWRMAQTRFAHLL